MNKESSKDHNFIILVCECLSAFFLISFFSYGTTPFLEWPYSVDVDVFEVAARAINQGKLIYRDFYDLKGPVFYFIYSFMQRYVHLRVSVFPLQVVLAWLSIFLIDCICSLNDLKTGSRVVVYAVYMYGYCAMIWGGGKPEELALPMNLGIIYATLRFLKALEKDEMARIPFASVFLAGLFFGICFFSKVTVAIPMMAAVLTVFIRLIVVKRGRDIGKCALLFISGFLVLTIPLIAYFIYHGLLDSMIRWTVINAIERSKYNAYMRMVRVFQGLAVCYLSLPMFYERMKSRKLREEHTVIFITSILILVDLRMAESLGYYYLLTLPVVVLILVSMFREKKEADNRGFIIAMLCILIFVFAQGSEIVSETEEAYGYFSDGKYREYVRELKEMAEMVPDSDREEIFNVSFGTPFFAVNHIVPANNVYAGVILMGLLDENIKTERLNQIKHDPPRWIVSQKDLKDTESDEMKDLISSKYEMVFSSDADCELWRLKE